MASRKPDPYKVDNETAPLTDEEIARLRPAKEVFEELGLDAPRPRGRPKLDTPKKSVTIRFDQDIIEHFKSDGRGWQSRINAALHEWIGEKARRRAQ